MVCYALNGDCNVDFYNFIAFPPTICYTKSNFINWFEILPV